MITAYLKPTNRCNVGCTHCYLPLSVRADAYVMTMDMLKTSLEFLAEMQARGRHSDVQILWHGGEPLVLRAEWYYRADELIQAILPSARQAIQTSLIPLREDHLPLIRDKFSGFAGSSIDFSQRQINGSIEAYHKLWMSKVEMARAAGITVVPGVVPTTADLGKEAEMVSWFADRDFGAFNVDRYNSFGTTFDDRPSNLQHSQFLIALFDALMERMEKFGAAPINRAVYAGLLGVMYGISGDRWGGSCTSSFVVIEPNGDLNNCPDKSSFEPAYSNVTQGYAEFARSKFRKKWVRHQVLEHAEDHCVSCENQIFCKSGCPITANGSVNGEDGCSGYFPFLRHLRNFVSQKDRRDLVLSYLNQDQNVATLNATNVYAAGAAESCSL